MCSYFMQHIKYFASDKIIARAETFTQAGPKKPHYKNVSSTSITTKYLKTLVFGEEQNQIEDAELTIASFK